MEPVIRFEQLSFQYNAQKDKTLKDISLTVHRGEKLVIAGPSGSGKSTIAHLINGLIPFSFPGEIWGSLRVCGKETKEAGIFALSRHVGTVLQDTDGQFIALTVAEDIAFVMENDCVPQADMKARVHGLASLVDVEEQLKHSPQALSGGQKQRVSLAGVMANDVDILLFDEPLANLDPYTGAQAVELIDEIGRRTGAAILIIEHRLEDALRRGADRVVLMDEGRIVADLKPDELLATDLLAKTGIREPLYLAALRYVGLAIAPEMRAARIDSLRLDEKQKGAVRDWFAAEPTQSVSESEETALTVRDLGFSYDGEREALDGVRFTVRKGEMLSVVGRNGAGKSTLAKLICGFEKPDRGDILSEGRSLLGDSIKERAARIGYVMQNPNQMISKPLVFDEVALSMRMAGVAEAEVEERVNETLKICGLYPMRHWPISALSYGQKKRVTIASVLVDRPQIILLDEPTAGQDLRHYTEFMEFLRELNGRGVTVIMVTHDMHLMLEYSRRALVFSRGRLIMDAEPAEVLTNEQVIREGNLRRSSLYDLALLVGLEPLPFVRRFISCDREARAHGGS